MINVQFNLVHAMLMCVFIRGEPNFMCRPGNGQLFSCLGGCEARVIPVGTGNIQCWALLHELRTDKISLEGRTRTMRKRRETPSAER